MPNGVIAFGDFKGNTHGWGFYLNQIEYSGYKTRDAARDAYRKCKNDMFKLFNKYGCSDGQDEYKELKRFTSKKH